MSDGSLGVALSGHRDYVGGLWDQIGLMQFEFLVSEGLMPGHVLLDIGCGALRGGIHFIPYLDPGHYLGIDKTRTLIRRGLRSELPDEVRRQRRPHFVVSDRFEFQRFPLAADFALAQSLFTHLPARDITRCLEKLRLYAPQCRLYATFFEVERTGVNPSMAHSRQGFSYTREQMASHGAGLGWVFRYIGDWGHPRGQMMGEYRPE